MHAKGVAELLSLRDAACAFSFFSSRNVEGSGRSLDSRLRDSCAVFRGDPDPYCEIPILFDVDSSRE